MTDEQLKEIADQLDFGFRCFVHRENKKVIFIPDEQKYGGMDTESWEAEIEEIDANGTDYFEVEKMDSTESFKVMEDFADTVDDTAIQNRLRESLQRPKPFQNFRFDIDRSGPYRDRWFKFKENALRDWVKRQLKAADLL